VGSTLHEHGEVRENDHGEEECGRGGGLGPNRNARRQMGES
jgi:hypothetical protein